MILLERQLIIQKISAAITSPGLTHLHLLDMWLSLLALAIFLYSMSFYLTQDINLAFVITIS